MPRIFISYRRDESTGYAGRIHERLAALYGADSVFMHVDNIQPGTDFVAAIDRHISTCDALVVLIGNRWLSAQDSTGRRRIDDPEDFVRSKSLNHSPATRRSFLCSLTARQCRPRKACHSPFGD